MVSIDDEIKVAKLPKQDFNEMGEIETNQMVLVWTMDVEKSYYDDDLLKIITFTYLPDVYVTIVDLNHLEKDSRVMLATYEMS